jgi:hypothetical protein
MPPKPPQINTSWIVGKTCRFNKVTSTTSYGVTRAALLDLFVMATSSTAAYRIFDSVKLRRIRIWGQPPGSAAPGSANVAPISSAVQWLSSLGPSKVVSDQGIGSAFGSRLDTRPPKNSLASFWSLTASDETEVLFYVTLNPGDVLDLDLTCTIQNNLYGGDAPVSITIIAGTTGTVYMTALDISASGAGALILPVQYNTIT